MNVCKALSEVLGVQIVQYRSWFLCHLSSYSVGTSGDIVVKKKMLCVAYQTVQAPDRVKALRPLVVSECFSKWVLQPSWNLKLHHQESEF